MIAILLAGSIATLISLFGTRYLIIFFRTRGQGQPILGKEDHGPEHHMVKQGTPTMGGIAIDQDGRVQREGGGVIAGLYAAGSASGGMEGGANHAYIGGLAKAVVTGLRVAESLGRART